MKTKRWRMSSRVLVIILSFFIVMAAFMVGTIYTAHATQIGNQPLFVDLSAQSKTYSGVNTYYSNEEKYTDGKYIGYYSGNYSDLGGYLYRVDIIGANSQNQYAEGFKIAWNGGEKFIAYESGKNCIVVDSSGNLSWKSVSGFKLMSGKGTAGANTNLGFFTNTSGTNYSLSVSLPANTTYSLYIIDITNGKDWRDSSSVITRSSNSKTLRQYGSLNDCTDRVQTLTTDVAGTYTFSFNANSGTADNFTVTYPVVETLYTVTVNGGSHGSVSTTSVQAGSTTTPSLPTPTADLGWKFKEWTTSSSSITINNPKNASGATVNATGDGTVTATYEKDDSLQLYIGGRFRVRASANASSFTTTYGNSGNWNDSSTSIPFTFDSTEGKYKLNTYCSLAELSEQVNANGYTNNQYFMVYDKTNSAHYYPQSSSTKFTSSVTSLDMSSSDSSHTARFDYDSPRSPVTIWFDATTKTLSYEAPQFYTVSFGSTSNGSFTVNSNSSSFDVAQGTTMTVTPSPNTHYEVNTVKYNDGSDHTISLSGGAYTFTMPAHDVTVTVTFKKKNFSFTTAMSPSNAGATVTPANGEVASGESASITASDKLTDGCGYKFNKWTTSTGYFASWGGSTSSSSSTVLFFPSQANAIATANYTQVRKITLPTVDNATVTAKYTNYAGSANQSLSEGNSASVKVGTAVTLTITADYGYKVNTVKAGSTTLSGTNYSYTVTAGNTAVAYSISIVEDTSTPWKIVVSNQASTSGGSSNSYDFTKKSGHENVIQKVGYCSIANLSANTNYYFKVYTGSAYYRTNNVSISDNEEYVDFNLTSDGNNVKLTTTAGGTYEFVIDFSGSTPKVKVLFPRPTITYSALGANATYGSDLVTEAKAGTLITFKVKPSDYYCVSAATVAYGTSSSTTVNISTDVDADGYVTCTFTMPTANATVSVTTTQISITATPNSATAGKITDIQTSSGTSVNPTKNNSTGVATCVGKFKIGDTYKLVVDANSNGLYCLKEDSTDIGGTNVSYNSISHNINRYVYSCTVLNGSVSANIMFRATTPTISAPASKNMIVDTPFSIQDVVNSISNYTSVQYKWSTASSYNTIAFSSKTIQAPTSYQTKTINIRATNTRSDISDTTRKTATSEDASVSLIFDFAQSNINVYIDTHGMNVSNLKVGIYSDSDGDHIVKRSDGTNYEFDLSQQDGSDEKGNLYDSSNNRIKSNVWATGQSSIPKMDSSLIYLKVTSTSPSLSKIIQISSSQLPDADSSDVRDIWLEIVKNAEMKSQIKTAAPQNQVVGDGKVRMYFMVPSDWNDWTSLYYYTWNDKWTDTWNSSNACTKLGKDSSGNTYYYADIKNDSQMIILKKAADSDSESETTKHENYAIGIKGSDGTYKYEHNYFKLANDSSTRKPIIQWCGEDVVVPKITKYTSLIAANTTDTRVYNITPTYKSEDGMSVEYSSEAASFASVTSAGVVSPLQDTYSDNTYKTNGVKITVTLKSKIDNLVTTDREHSDKQTVFTYVKVNDPDKYDGIGLMSYETNTSKVLINPVTIDQDDSANPLEYPAYFNNVKTFTSGTATKTTYNYGGSVIDLDANKHVATIKYAKASNLEYTFQNSETFAYNSISVTGQADAQEADEDKITHNRYGFYNSWFSTDTTPTLPSEFSTIFGRTALSTNRDYTFSIVDGTNYIMRFEPYDYTDVAVTFWYYQYNPCATVDGKTTYKYYYDSSKRHYDQAGLDNQTTPTTLTNRDNHNIKHFTSVTEVRYWDSEDTRINQTTAPAALSRYVAQSARNVADNYYSYSYEASDIYNSGWAVESGSQNKHRLNVFVWMHDEPREYNFQYTNENGITSTLKKDCHYQEYVEALAAGDTSVKWYDTRNTPSTEDDILLATSPSYRFRISGNTYLRAVALSSGEKELSDEPNSTVTYCNNEYESVAVTADGKTTYIEYLFQNFFINDYFNTSMVTYTPKTPHYDSYGDIDKYVDGDPTPYDDITFVGAGVFYYSVDNDGVPIKDAITREDYADSVNYVTNNDTVGDRLFELIKNANSSKVPEGLIDEEYLQSVFSYEIKETVDEVSGEKTGLVYRYLPAYNFTYVTKNEGTEDEYKTILSRTFDDKVYRYSSMLGAYQYIYPVRVKNNSDNNNKNIKLHSYYIYRYTDYDHDEDFNEVYKIVISEAAIAPTYMLLTQNE